AGPHAAERRVALRAHVAEVVGGRHVVAVALRGLLEVPVGGQGALALRGAFAVDQAKRGGANARGVFGRGREVGVRAAAAARGRHAHAEGLHVSVPTRGVVSPPHAVMEAAWMRAMTVRGPARADARASRVRAARMGMNARAAAGAVRMGMV